MAAAPVTLPWLPPCRKCMGVGRLNLSPTGDGVSRSIPCKHCAGTGKSRLKVRLVVGVKGATYWNLLWSDGPDGIPRVPMRGGSFPASHPVVAAGDGGRGLQFGGGKMDEFRGLGYWASCFPEGDGVTFQPEHEQGVDQVIHDVERVFGWQVVR